MRRQRGCYLQGYELFAVSESEYDVIEMLRHTQLNDVADSTHDQETNTDSLAESEELLLISYKNRKSVHPPAFTQRPSFKLDVRLVHLRMNWIPSLANSEGTSRSS